MEKPTATAQEKFSLVDQHRRMLASMNFYLDRKSSTILDFGCGDGKQVYEYRDRGFDAHGFDIRPAVLLRRPEDEKYFRFALTGKPADIPEFQVNASFYRIPFEDEKFDFIFSTSTLEHVQDHELAFAETARVLKSDGVAIHTFPGRYCLVEPHMYVPLGGVVQNYYWFFLWALLGTRNEFQGNMAPAERAKHNLHYSRNGLRYPKLEDIRRWARRHYRRVECLPWLWESGYEGSVSWKGVLLCAPFIQRFYRSIYSRIDTVVLFLQK